MSNVRKLPLWALSFLVVLGLHIGVALWAMFWQIKPPPLELPPAAPVMLAVLAPPPPPPPPPVTVATPQVQVETPPEPKLVEAPKPVLAVAKPKPKPKKKVEPPKKVVKKVEPKKVVPPKPKPVETVAKTPSPVSDENSKADSASKVASAASAASASSSAGGAPQAGNSSSSGAKVTWQGLLLSHLGRYKKYPDAAKRYERVGARRVNRLRFVINASGQVLSYKLVGASGNELLDQATLDMIERAQPLPPPPPELLHNGVLEIVAPFVYELKR